MAPIERYKSVARQLIEQDHALCILGEVGETGTCMVTYPDKPPGRWVKFKAWLAGAPGLGALDYFRSARENKDLYLSDVERCERESDELLPAISSLENQLQEPLERYRLNWPNLQGMADFVGDSARFSHAATPAVVLQQCIDFGMSAIPSAQLLKLRTMLSGERGKALARQLRLAPGATGEDLASAFYVGFVRAITLQSGAAANGADTVVAPSVQ